MKNSMKIYLSMLSLCLLILASCKKNDPITELGSTNNEFASQLRVTYNKTKPMFGDTLIVSASSWQRDDKFKNIVIYETVVESVGLQLALKNGTTLTTKTADESTLTLVDTIAKKVIALDVNAADLDKYWVTSSNNYVINYEYKVLPKVGKFANDPTLITALADPEFAILKGLLAYSITKNDYLTLFPSAPTSGSNSHFTTGGTYVLSATGMSNLRTNATREMLAADVLTIKKVGIYSITIDVNAVTPTNTITATTRTFDITL